MSYECQEPRTKYLPPEIYVAAKLGWSYNGERDRWTRNGCEAFIERQPQGVIVRFPGSRSRDRHFDSMELAIQFAEEEIYEPTHV